MDEVVSLITHQPLYGLIAALLVLFVVLTIAKKLVKLALIACIVFAAYVWFMHAQGKQVRLPRIDTEKVLDQGREAADKLGDAAKDARDHAKDAVDRAKDEAKRAKDR